MTATGNPENPKDSKVAIVTGYRRGIGRGCALELAKRGFNVVVCARTLDEGQAFEHSSTVKGSKTTPLPGSLEKTAREIEALGGRALTVRPPARAVSGGASNQMLARHGGHGGPPHYFCSDF